MRGRIPEDDGPRSVSHKHVRPVVRIVPASNGIGKTVMLRLEKIRD